MAIRATKKPYNTMTPLRTTKTPLLHTPKILWKVYNLRGGRGYGPIHRPKKPETGKSSQTPLLLRSKNSRLGYNFSGVVSFIFLLNASISPTSILYLLANCPKFRCNALSSPPLQPHFIVFLWFFREIPFCLL